MKNKRSRVHAVMEKSDTSPLVNLHHLRYFLDAARLGAISKSAQRHSVSQSAVSQAIRSLETHFQTELVLHQQNRFQLSPAGHRLMVAAQDLLSQTAEMDQLMGATVREMPALNVGCSMSLGLRFLPEVIREFQKASPEIRVSLRVGNSESLRRWLSEGTIDLALMVDDHKKQKSTKSVMVGSGRFILFRSSKRILPWTDGVIVTSKERPEVRSLRAAFQRRKPGRSQGPESRSKSGSEPGPGSTSASTSRELPIRMEILSWEVIRRFVITVGGCGFVPDYVIQRELKSGKVTSVDISMSPITYRLIALQATPLTASKRQRLDGLQSLARDLFSVFVQGFRSVSEGAERS